MSVDIERSTKQTKWRWTVTLNEEKDDNTDRGEDHAVELVTGTYKNPHYSMVYRRNTRDRLHVEIDMRPTTAEDTMSALAKLMGAAEELRSGVTDHRRIPATSVERNAFSRQAACQKQVDDESLQGEGWIHEERWMSSIPLYSVSTFNVRVNERTRRTTF